MDSVPDVILLLALIVIPICCLVNSLVFGREIRCGRQPVRYRARNTVGWGLLDMGVYVVVLAVVAGAGVTLAYGHVGATPDVPLEELPAEDQATVMLAYGLSTLIAAAVCLGWNGLRFQKLDAFETAMISADIGMGARWFCVLIVPVLAMQFLLNQWFPTHHPLIDMLLESGDTSLLPVAAFVAVVSAPVFEEIFFRLLLQGWLEKLQITSCRTQHGLTSKADRDAVLLGGATSATWPSEPGLAPRDELQERPVLWIPIMMSSALFAGAHWGHGPDWVALFFLALGLGYLYQRTGSVVPSMVVHFLVNALGVVQLWGSLESVRRGL